MYVILYGGTSSHNMQLTEFGIPTSINIGRYALDTIILEMRSEVTVTVTELRSAVGNVSGYRCVSDCRSRGREFDPGPVPYFRGD